MCYLLFVVIGHTLYLLGVFLCVEYTVKLKAKLVMQVMYLRDALFQWQGYRYPVMFGCAFC